MRRTPSTLLGACIRGLKAGQSIRVRPRTRMVLSMLCHYHIGAGKYRTRRCGPGAWTVTRLA